jgi:Putative MetA-pathway of phenol degradation
MNAARKAICALCLAGLPIPALAGPPYETDDPQPTDRGHWEIYTFGTREGAANDFGGSYGLDLNYGPVEGVQLTATLPITYTQATGSALSDVELGVKYRFVHHEAAGFDLAIFPRIILPTAGKGRGTGRVSLLLPVWAQKTLGKWALFGGGGYTINPGLGQRDYATGSIALTRTLSDRLSLGIEATRTGPDAADTRTQTALGIGGTLRLNDHVALLLAGGPTFEDGASPTRYHAYAALGFQF